jgi:hypothetical protein
VRAALDRDELEVVDQPRKPANVGFSRFSGPAPARLHHGQIRLSEPVGTTGEPLAANVHALDFRNGRQIVDWSNNPDALACRPHTSRIPALRLVHTGRIAWIAKEIAYQTESCSGGAVYYVYKVVRPNRPRLLDTGPGIDPTSLRIRSGRMYWRNNGQTRTSSLR